MKVHFIKICDEYRYLWIHTTIGSSSTASPGTKSLPVGAAVPENSNHSLL